MRRRAFFRIARTLIVAGAFAGLRLTLGALFAPNALAQQVNLEELAKKIVHTSANVKPGDVVVVYGGLHTTPFMEDLAIEAQKSGGMPTMFLSSDRVVRSFFTQVPEKYLEQSPDYLTAWFKTINVWIGLPGIKDNRAVLGDVPEARFAKANKAAQAFNDSLNDSSVRGIFVGYPTEQDAAANHLDFATYEKVFWAQVNADYKAISGQGNSLKAMFQAAKTVHVTSPGGTDFTFSPDASRPIFVDDGIVTEEKAKSKYVVERTVNLPGGAIFFAPVETSAQGKVFVPRNQCRFAPFNGASFDFKDGRLQNFKAEEGGNCFKQVMAPYPDAKYLLGSFQIGLNPEAKVMEDPGDYRPGNAAGLVYINIGDNSLLGGNNRAQFGGFGFPITHATVEVGGKVVVKNGHLTL